MSNPSPSSIGGLERDPVTQGSDLEGMLIPDACWRLIQVDMRDRTDLHDSLVQEHVFLLHPTSPLQLQGNLFVLEDPLEHSGSILLREAPLPASRPQAAPWDLEVTASPSGGYRLRGWQDPMLENWVQLPYQGGRLGRTQVLQNWQRSRRPATSGHLIPAALSNTWGDRSRDSRMNEAFMLGEIACASELGIQVVQLDDGWQKGMTVNSAQAVSGGGGHWEGFWNADPEFWTPHPTRFPRGLEPVLEAATKQGVELGLWYAPDSWQEFANWQRDADCILGLYRSLGVRYFKLDSINAASETAFANLRRFTGHVLTESQGEVVFDLDITGDHPRPGYWGAVDVGPIFLENRYTDWKNYRPHHTLRNLWQLGSWVDPLRLRMEWLNPHRNQELYGSHLLAPGNWPITTLCGITLPANPLCWCELQVLPEQDRQALKPLFARWSEFRNEWAEGTILPLGDSPDGYGISAFASFHPSQEVMQLMVIRGLGPENKRLEIGPVLGNTSHCEVIFGEGQAQLRDRDINVQVEKPLGFCWFRFSPQ